MCALSQLQQVRLHFQPTRPKALADLHAIDLVPLTDVAYTSDVAAQVAAMFPHIANHYPLVFAHNGAGESVPMRVGVVLSGGQAPGGHNVIAGLFDGLKSLHAGSALFGFLNGPAGISGGHSVEITSSLLAPYRNQGGFDLIGSGRDKIESAIQLQAAEETVRQLHLDGLVVIGGDDSNTNAAVLAEYFAAHGNRAVVIGVPKTIDGDLKNAAVEASFGFDTASKTYAAIIGDIMRDALSAKKSYYFIKLMGRSASHITLECALQTHPNLALIGEEIALNQKRLRELVDEMCDLICMRSQQGKEYGVFLIPEGVIEFIPEVKLLIQELNALLAHDNAHVSAMESLSGDMAKKNYITEKLSPASADCFKSLPSSICAQLLISRDPHGNVQVSKVETERLFIEMVAAALKDRQKAGKYAGKFSAQPHFCGYEGRSCLPSNFDSQYCYALGLVAAALVNGRANGYMACVQNLTAEVGAWKPFGIPLVSMMTSEQRHGVPKPVIKKALVDLLGKPFKAFEKQRQSWAIADDYTSPGPIQFFGAPALTDGVTITLSLEGSK